MRCMQDYYDYDVHTGFHTGFSVGGSNASVLSPPIHRDKS